MRDRDLPAMRDYLAAERAWYDRWLESVRGRREELAAELTARTPPPAEESVKLEPGLLHLLHPDRPWSGVRAVLPGRRSPPPPSVLLDENLLRRRIRPAAATLGLGVREISPDGRLLAYSVDFDGDELYQLRIRDLARGTDLPERIEGTYYGLAWSADSRSLLYVVTDAQYRPHEVRRHVLGTDPQRDTLVFREEDQRFDLTVRATRSGGYVLIESESRDSTETLVLPAAGTDSSPLVVEAQARYRVSRRACRRTGRGRLFLVTNSGAEEFRLVAAPATHLARTGGALLAGGHRTGRDTRLVSVDVFGRYLVVEQRRAAATQLRIVDRQSGEHRLIERGRPAPLARPGPERGLPRHGGDRAHRVAGRAAVLARRGPGHRPLAGAQAAARAWLRSGALHYRAGQRGRGGRHPFL